MVVCSVSNGVTVFAGLVTLMCRYFALACFYHSLQNHINHALLQTPQHALAIMSSMYEFHSKLAGSHDYFHPMPNSYFTDLPFS